MAKKIQIFGKGRYAVGEHQQFVDRTGQLVRVIRENPTKPIPVGEAYAFFDCEASKEQIEAELPLIRECVKTPNALELSLMENPDKKLRVIATSASRTISFNVEYDLVIKALKEGGDLKKYLPRAVRLAQMATLGNRRGIGNKSGARYALKATYPNATNHQTVDELSSILNQAYQSPLYQKGEQFRGEIVYKEEGRYVFRE